MKEQKLVRKIQDLEAGEKEEKKGVKHFKTSAQN